MARRPSKAVAASNRDAREVTEMARPWLLGVLVTLCVARPLIPSEGSAWLGDGLPFDLLLLLLAVGTGSLALARGGFERRLGWLDAAVLALVLACVTSALAGLWTFQFLESYDTPGAREVTPRQTLNMLWEWIGLGLVFLLARQLILRTREARVVVAVMVSLAVSLSLLGFYQVLIALPAERAVYQADPDQALRSIGHWSPAGSVERARFEDRLNSTEPLATFALANTLAGFLAPWLLVLLGVAWSYWQGTRGRPQAGWQARVTADPLLDALRLGGLLICLCAVFVCTVMTKSRSAYAALAVGVVLMPWAIGPRWHFCRWRLGVALGLCVTALVTALVVLGSLDIEVLTEARKSLGYRWEYWQATLAMIADYPLLGVAPGNFQDYYTSYKLPTASEEVRDPHNFVLEVWATAGVLGLAALAAVGGVFAWNCLRTPRARESDSQAFVEVPESSRTLWFPLVGAALGVGLAQLVGPPFDFVLPPGQAFAVFVIGAGVLGLLWPWILYGDLPSRLPAVGAIVMAIHWLAAGGISFAGVSYSFWLLLALAAGEVEAVAVRGSLPFGWRGRAIPLLATVAFAVAAIGCYQSGFAPVLEYRAAMSHALQPDLGPEARLAALARANQADPYAVEPWTGLAELSLAQLKLQPTNPAWQDRFTKATVATIALRRHSSATWGQVANWYRELATLDENPAWSARALQLSGGAAQLYPNSATLQAEHALALAASGKSGAGRRTAKVALDLDATTPHRDKKLPAALKTQVERLADAPADSTPDPAGSLK